MTQFSFVAILIAVMSVFLLQQFTKATQHHHTRNQNSDSQQSTENSHQTLNLDVDKVVIDTDAGVDDAEAIFLALGEENLFGKSKVIGITCGHGNAEIDDVVVNVLKTLDTVGRLDIPVYRGAPGSIHLTPKDEYFFGLDGFGDFEYLNAPDPKEYVQKKHAVLALIDIVDENPGEVTLLCLGPLTNVALAIRLDPLFLTKVRQVVIFGGSVEGVGDILPGIEFNFYVDPEAAFIVFNSTDTSVENISPIIIFPWESVISRHLIPIAWRKNVLGRLDSPQMRLLNKAANKSMENSTYYLSPDTFAAAITFRPEMVSDTSAAYVQVANCGEFAGAMFVDYENSLSKPSNAVIVRQLDVEAFKMMLLEDLG